MAKQQSKGSIILKFIILLLVLALILVIILPGRIWEQEDTIMDQSRTNMMTIYEAHRHYYRANNQYAIDNSDLINTVKHDSSLNMRQNIVNHTRTLRDAMENFLNASLVNSLNQISSNIKNIEDDFNTNERYFKSQDQEVLAKKIFDTSQELKLQLSTFRSGVEYENYRKVVLELDSLWQLRRDLTDYSLQSAARTASGLAKTIAQDIQAVDFKSMERVWNPLSSRLTAFLNRVNSIEKLKTLTTIADRVADFQAEIANGFNTVSSSNTSQTVQDAVAGASELEQVYQDFLADFLVTENFSQYSLSETDSLLLSISEDNFYTPGDRKPYLVTFQDTLGITVEDPTLLADLKAVAAKEAESINQLPFLQAFAAYDIELDSLQNYYMMVKRTYRRNLDITIKTKELDEVINKSKTTTAFESYYKLQSFADDIPQTTSYSQIKAESEAALISLGGFIQIYENNIFGNLDTVHVKIIEYLNEFNGLVSQVRRNRFSFDWAIESLNSALSRIKNVPASDVVPKMRNIEKNMGSVFLFASEGLDKNVYGVFTTKIVNHGKIFGTTGRKSWEEE
jgi:Tfp pilus assembly protein PilE